MYRKWSTLVLLSLVTPLLALAQNTGKLTGTITDRSTGETLPGVTVTIEGTTLGAVSDVDGQYTILGVPVGSYTVRAEYTGYNPSLYRGVDINSGYTRTLNFQMREGSAIDEIEVVYERPLIQNDALGAPRVATGEQITNLPVRGVAAVAALQAGVTNNEGSGTLNVRGGRGAEVVYYVDGVKVVGSLGVSQSAIQEQEMLIGGLPAKYGDAMAGVISVTTKNGSNRFFGTIDAVTSQALDAYGYSSAQVSLGGPIMGSKVGFFLSSELQNYDDQSPSAVKVPLLSDSKLAEVLAAPQVVRVLDANGQTAYRPIPADLPAGAKLKDVLQAGDKIDPQYGLANSFVNAATLLTSDDFTFSSAKPNNQLSGLNLSGKLNFAPVQSIRLVAGGQYIQRNFDSYSTGRSLFENNQNAQNDQYTGRGYLTWSHYLGQKTFYQLQADFQDFKAYSYDGDFGRDLMNVVKYNDFDEASNALARAYRTPRSLAGGTPTTSNPDSVTLGYQYSDNAFPGTLSSIYTLPGGSNNGYSKSNTQQWRVSGNAQTQLGLHLLEFGGEYEQRTLRAFSIGAGTLTYLARRFNDGNVELGSSQGFDSYDQLTFTDLKNRTSYYGYSFNGMSETDTENLSTFSAAKDGTEGQIAPLKPIYYAGYISDKIEYRDIVVQLGVRADVYDSNQRVLADPYSLLPIVRAGDVNLSTNLIGSDYAVYYNGNNVTGFRDKNGKFYNTQGQVVTPNAVITNSAVTPRIADGATPGVLDERAFEDYKPKAVFQPRIGVTFPVTDRALFFAHYDVLAQRPTTNGFATLTDYQARLAGSGSIGNPDLEPQKTTEYELGFRQRLGERAALQISGFYRQIDNLIQLRALKNVYPGNYSTYRNVDFGTVKGVEFGFDLRRTHNVELNANYTLSFAEGTGSDANTTGNIFWLREATPFVPNFLSPLDFDRRHTANLSLDYRLGENEGPTIAGTKLLENFGVNMIATFKSGQPYSKLQDPYNRLYAVRLTGLQGEINGQTLPSSTLLNLKVDRRFNLGTRRSLTAYLEVENLLDQDNVVNVYGATGLADDDGYLSTQQGLSEYPEGSLDRDLYRYSLRSTGNYGIPRQTRLGLRLNF